MTKPNESWRFRLNNAIDTLLELCSMPGPSGFETPVALRASALLEECMDEVWTDVLGNVIGVRRCWKANACKLLFDAHIDETGLIITGAEEGFLRFAALGGADEKVLPAAEVKILSDQPLFGVVGVMPPHVLMKEETEKAVKIDDMFIDVGLSQEESEKAAPPGTPVVFAHGARLLGKNRMCGKALDDRAGFVSILRAIEKLGNTPLNADLYVMASVQEEVGTRGAAPGVYAIEPDQCVVIDVGHAKTPDSKPVETMEELDGGVIISRGPNMNAELTETAIKLAREYDIKHQINVEPGGNSGTNARAIQISRDGVATALLSIPMRYMHSAYEVLSLDDIESTARLLAEIAKKM